MYLVAAAVNKNLCLIFDIIQAHYPYETLNKKSETLKKYIET